MVSLASLDLLLRIVVPNVHPSVRRTTSDEAASGAVERNGCHLAVCRNVAEQVAGLRTGEEVYVLACGDSDRAVGVVVQTGIQLARGGSCGEREGRDSAASAQIVPAQVLVFAGGDEEVRVAGPDDGFDGALVVAGADLVRRAVGALNRSVRVGRSVCSAGDVENAQLLILASCCEHTRTLARRKGHGAHDVRVVESHEGLAGESVPNLCAEVGAAGCCESGIFGEPCAPNGALVSDERSNPVAGQAVAQHGVLVLACRDHVVLRAGGGGVEGGGEAQVGDGSRVAVAGQRDGLRGAGCDDLALILALEGEVGHFVGVLWWLVAVAVCASVCMRCKMQGLILRDFVRRYVLGVCSRERVLSVFCVITQVPTPVNQNQGNV